MIHLSRLMLAAALILACAVICAAQQRDPIIPDRAKTPGVAAEGITKADVCTCGYTAAA